MADTSSSTSCVVKTPKTALERKRKSRASMSEEKKKEELLKNEERRKKKLRQMSDLELNQTRENARLRKQKSRSAKKLDKGASSSNSEDSVGGFKSKQSKCKAVVKLFNNLPSTPRKQKQAVQGLAKRIGYNLEQKAEENITHKNKNAIETETIGLVRDFLFQNRFGLYYAWDERPNDCEGKWSKEKRKKILPSDVFKRGFCSFQANPSRSKNWLYKVHSIKTSQCSVDR